jgi:DNA-binding transcriptional LysR family regulator
MYNCLKLNVGYTICPEIIARDQFVDGELVELKWASTPFETSVIMIWHAEKWCSPLLKHFMAISREFIT